VAKQDDLRGFSFFQGIMVADPRGFFAGR